MYNHNLNTYSTNMYAAAVSTATPEGNLRIHE